MHSLGESTRRISNFHGGSRRYDKPNPYSYFNWSRASLSYVSPKLVEKCKLLVENFENSWLVQLATGAKRKVTCFVKECVVVMDQFETVVNLNVLPLGSYDLLIGMDWLEQHRVILNCYDKTFVRIIKSLLATLDIN